jgi:hypothetical protein
MRRLAVVFVFLGLVWPVVALAYLERVIVDRTEGSCLLRVETDEHAKIVRLRVIPEDVTCAISKEAMQSILRESFAKTESPRLEGEYRALSLGRLMDYPWLASALAKTAHRDLSWDSRRGRPRSMDLYTYVRTLLFSPEMIGPFSQALAGSGNRIVAVMVEKVCVGRVGDIPRYDGPPLPGKVPIDAQVWLYLEQECPADQD